MPKLKAEKFDTQQIDLKQLATKFAESITAPSSDNDWIARKGVKSLFSALQEILPQVRCRFDRVHEFKIKMHFELSIDFDSTDYSTFCTPIPFQREDYDRWIQQNAPVQWVWMRTNTNEAIRGVKKK